MSDCSSTFGSKGHGTKNSTTTRGGMITDGHSMTSNKWMACVVLSEMFVALLVLKVCYRHAGLQGYKFQRLTADRNGVKD